MRKIILIASLFFFPVISLASTYGANFLIGGTPTCSETDGNCSLAFDGNTATQSGTTNTAWPHTIDYDLGSGITKTFARLYIQPLSTANGTYLKDFEIYAGSNGSTWYLLGSGSIPTGTTDTWRTFDFTPSSTAYRYLRLKGLNNSHTNANYLFVNEFQAMECLDCGGAGQATTTYYTDLMSEQTDFMVQLLIEAIFVIMGLGAGYLIIRKFTKK